MLYLIKVMNRLIFKLVCVCSLIVFSIGTINSDLLVNAQEVNFGEVCDIDDYEDNAEPLENYSTDDDYIEEVYDYEILDDDSENDVDTYSSSNILSGGKQLNVGESIVNGNYKAIMQGDGNFVIYNGSSATFSTRTSGSNCFAKMQTDGNFVIYNSSGSALWATRTNLNGSSHSYSLVLSSSGELNVKDNTNGYKLWSTKNSISNTSLYAGNCISSSNRNYMGVMQGDGNFVIYYLNAGKRSAVWATGTSGNNNSFLSSQSDGNIVVYSSSKKAIFATGTNHGTSYSYRLTLTDGGYLQLVKNNSRSIWTSKKTVSLGVSGICQLDYTGTYDGKHSVSQNGCFVSCMAMVENFETFSSYNPYNIKNIGITFDSSGGYTSIPSRYKDTNYGLQNLSTSMLKEIYGVLKKGHPVIISRYNSQGKQHFVVITGYTGDGSSYAASQFIVLNPGSKSVPTTTLNQIVTSGYGIRHIVYLK